MIFAKFPSSVSDFPLLLACKQNFGFPSSVYDQIFGGNQWVWPLWSFSVSNNFAQKWVSVQRDTWINISDSDTLTQGDLTQGVALDQNSFLGDTENDVWPKLSWLPPSIVPGKCSFILCHIAVCAWAVRLGLDHVRTNTSLDHPMKDYGRV